MKLGNDEHEKILNLTMNELYHQGYKVISLAGRSPSAIGTKENKLYAIVINSHETKKKLDYLYCMFDTILSLKILKNDNLNSKLDSLREDGFNIIKMNMKSPDAIATKNNKLYAIEILGFKEGHSSSYAIKLKEKCERYNDFDGLMIRSFKYGDTKFFTEYFGSSTRSTRVGVMV